MQSKSLKIPSRSKQMIQEQMRPLPLWIDRQVPTYSTIALILLNIASYYWLLEETNPTVVLTV